MKYNFDTMKLKTSDFPHVPTIDDVFKAALEFSDAHAVISFDMFIDAITFEQDNNPDEHLRELAGVILSYVLNNKDFRDTLYYYLHDRNIRELKNP